MPTNSTEATPTARRARLVHDDRGQVLKIPKDLALDCEEVRIFRKGTRLVLEPVPKPTGLAALLASWSALPEELPDPDADLLPLDDVSL
ncbi:MAG: AbrB/MazE/SpoVT family DNA-binding domain-containing protein [Acidobacteria bacterium]|nr:AbrB/MazE/SpoVT family DNA-binding domain-containing protein [Acidobacteriota bacterium]